MATVESRKGTRKFSGSIGAGVRSIMNSGKRTFFIIEHRSNTAKHRAGESQEIIVDYLEMGRGTKYGISFGEDCKTVSGSSGPHAAITHEANGYVIRHMGKNPTLVNGRPVNKQWYLQSGDEIQLSVEGPRLGFMVPQQNTVSSIPLSRRLSLFRQQALRPYKQAMWVLSVILLVGFSLGGYGLYRQHITIDIMEKEKAELTEQIRSKLDYYEKTNVSLKNDLSRLKKLQHENASKDHDIIASGEGATGEGSKGTRALFPNVYFIYCKGITVTYQGQTETVDDYNWSGTGFLLNDGRFITARHVVEPWAYLTSEPSEMDLNLNRIMNDGGKIVATLNVFSPDGSAFEVTTSDFTCNRSPDEQVEVTDEEGNSFTVSFANFQNGTDWAMVHTNRPNGLEFDSNKSNNLRQGERLHILGYPKGLGADSRDDISPLYCNTDVAQDGLHGGIIRVTNRNFDHGNSGGPVFYLDNNGNYKVIGIVSAGIGDAVGFIIPISAVGRQNN
jgi:hypothetical protein